MKKTDTTWKKIGEFRKTSKPHIFVGTVVFPDTGIEMKALIFLKTREQKVKSSDPDMSLLLPDFPDKKDETPDF